MVAKCQIRYESERLCLSPTCFCVSPWSPGNNQSVLIRAALVITMMKHHRLEAVFGASHSQIKTPLPPVPVRAPAGQTKHRFFPSLAAGEHVSSEERPSGVPGRLPVASGDGCGPPRRKHTVMEMCCVGPDGLHNTLPLNAHVGSSASEMLGVVGGNIRKRIWKHI